MRIEIESSSAYGISPNNYKVKIEKEDSEIINQQILESINQAIYQAFELTYEEEL